MDHYRNMIFFVPETQAYRTSASFDLYPQHCQLPTLSEQQHNETVVTEWLESLQRLKNKSKRKAIKEIKRAIETIVAGGKLPTTEGGKATTEGEQAQPVPITTSTNPTNPRVLAQ